MTIDAKLFGLLTASPSPIENLQVWQGSAGQRAQRPYVVLSFIGETPFEAQDQQQTPIATRRHRCQVSVFSVDYDQARRVNRAACDYLLGYTDRPAAGIQAIRKLSAMTVFEESERSYHATADLDIVENL